MSTQLKDSLLTSGFFKDGNWFESYCELIESNLDTIYVKGKMHAHHIIPVCFAADNSQYFGTVNLLYYQHIQAHCLLALCSISKRKRMQMLSAVNYLTNRRYKLSDIDSEFLQSLVEYQAVYELMYRELSENNVMRCPEVYKKHSDKMKSDSVRKAISDTMKRKVMAGELFSEEHRKKLSDSRKGKTYVNNGIVDRYVSLKEAQELIKQGWERGTKKGVMSDEHRKAIIKFHTGYIFSDESRKKMSLSHMGKSPANKGVPLSDETKAKLSASIRGRRRMNNGEVEKLVKPEFICKFLAEGFQFGKLKRG